MQALKDRIRHVPDFPKPGILFYDVTTLLRDPEGFKLAIDTLAEPYYSRGISLVVGIESRGFILGAAVADRIGAVTAELRGFSRRGAGELRAVTLDTVIDGALLILREQLRPIALERPAPDPSRRVLAGRVRLEQVVVNLLQNAIEALADDNSPVRQERLARIAGYSPLSWNDHVRRARALMEQTGA